jgi:cardiolipin synthase
MPRSLIVLPDDTAQPILDAIRGATKSLRIKMFVLSDLRIVRALLQAHKRSVRVRIMLSPHRRDGERQNGVSRKMFAKSGIEVQDTSPAFDVTHEKSMIADDKTAFVQSLNWASKNFTKTRDYAVITSEAKEVAEIVECFEADWRRRKFSPGRRSNLIWCPQKGRERIVSFIDAAKHSLIVQNERYQDAIIIEHLVKAKLRGVKVHVMSRPPHSLKAEKLIEDIGGLQLMHAAGIKIRRLKHLKLHAKILLADRRRAIIGSINLSPGSFDKRRELAIELTDRNILRRLHKAVQRDWKKSRTLDLTDIAMLTSSKSAPTS